MEASKKAFFQAAFDNQRWDSTPMYENCPSFYKAVVGGRNSDGTGGQRGPFEPRWGHKHIKNKREFKP
eukprot:2257939-Pyramimonas_sp.AAC.1